jgi:UPF0176 protein
MFSFCHASGAKRKQDSHLQVREVHVSNLMNILNISAYKFLSINPQDFRDVFLTKARNCKLKGTVLLSTEGINLFVAGEESSTRDFCTFIGTFEPFSDMTYKESWSEEIPFKKMMVKIKPEIITFGDKNSDPTKQTAKYITPQELKRWYDDNYPMVVLDTRNTYEIEHGKFANAHDLNIRHFVQFKQAADELNKIDKSTPIVTYCTGGIRCEKAALYLQQLGYTDVYQLEGGILNYFTEVGNAHFQGKCFVFDERITL